MLNGQKAWATNGGIAGVHVIVASVDRELGARGQAAFIVPPGTAGLTMGAKVKKHGLRASHTADVFLDDCRVPGSCLLGGKEKLDERLARAREGTRSRGQAAMRKLGAVQEGVLRRSLVTVDGIHHDQVLWSLLADDWRASTRADAVAQVH